MSVETRAKVTKEVLCEEARFILANVLAEGRYGKQNKLADIKRICEGNVTLPIGEYLAFLEAAGYLAYDKSRDTLDVTADGERVVTGERVQELMERAVAHFKAAKRAAQGQGAAPTAKPVPPAASPSSQGLAAPDLRESPRAAARPSGAARAAYAAGSPPPDAHERAHAVARGEIVARDLGGRYEKVAPIGSGGIGTVYRARHIPLEREVALKEIRELFAFFGDEQRREISRRFTEAVRAAGRLSHPNIVPIHDVALDREYPYVVTELMPQGSARRLISDAEEIPVGLVVKYLLQVLHALRAAHAAGVPHRGLKPENLLIDAHGNVKVTDFGFTRIVERDQAIIRQVYVGMGAVAYMAPELFTDPLGAGTQTDIYALGIIFYEMLTRKLPGRRSPMPSQVNADLPKGIDDIFDRMTRDDRTERYASVEKILEDWSKLDGMGKLVEANHGILFAENPIAALKFRAPAVPVPVPIAASPSAKTIIAPAGERDRDTAHGQGGVRAAPAGLGDEPEEPTAVGDDPGGGPPPASDPEGSRARNLGRRPYSYQQRLREK